MNERHLVVSENETTLMEGFNTLYMICLYRYVSHVRYVCIRKDRRWIVAPFFSLRLVSNHGPYLRHHPSHMPSLALAHDGQL